MVQSCQFDSSITELRVPHIPWRATMQPNRHPLLREGAAGGLEGLPAVVSALRKRSIDALQSAPESARPARGTGNVRRVPAHGLLPFEVSGPNP